MDFLARWARRTGYALAGFLAAAAPLGAGDSLWGTLLAVVDGETLLMEAGDEVYGVRLWGVLAPGAGQPLAAAAADFLRATALAREGRLRFEGRNVADEMVGRLFVDGVDLGLETVRRGFAWRNPSVRYPADPGTIDPLTAAEAEARAAGRGVWGVPGLVPPAAGSNDGEPLAESDVDRAPSGGGATDQNASLHSGDDNECALAQDPVDPDRLFLACNTNANALRAAKSADGGRTWTIADATDGTIADGDLNQGVAACCDPTLAWDEYGNLFVTYINSSIGTVVTLLSTDGGTTFTSVGSFTGSVDQPTVVTGRVGASGVVWVVYNKSGSMVAHGAAVTGLGAVGTFSAVQSAATSSCSFGDAAVSPGGVLVQVCGPTSGQGGGNIRINRDADGLGGAGFGPSIVVTNTEVGGFDFLPAQNGRSVDSETGLAYDKNPASPHYGRLYLVYNEEIVDESDDTEIYLRWSDDDAATWSSPIGINDDGTSRSQFLPKIASDPKTGAIGVCWHDARDSASNTAAEMYCSTYTPDPGATPSFSANVLVSDGASVSNGAGVEFGDYMGMAMVGGQPHPVWADTSNSTGDNPNGTSKFEAYSDYFSIPGLFTDGFESGDLFLWLSGI